MLKNYSYLLVVLLTAINVTANKIKTLSILSLVPKSGKEPSDARACIAAMQIVANVVNMRRDILPDYDVEIDFQDETKSAFAAPRAFVRGYLDSFEIKKNNVFKSPVVLGPSVSCQNIALILKVHHFTEFSEICTGQYLVSLKTRLSNLYRVQTVVANSIVALMMTVRYVGRWKQMAALTYSFNPNEYMMAEALQAHAAENGLELVYYASEPEVTPVVIENLKRSGARVVGLMVAQPGFCLAFFCMAYQAGIRGSQYAFVTMFFCTFSPDSPNLVFPKGCTREMLYEQLKITFWSGAYTSAAENYGTTSLGYDLTWFEQQIDLALNHSTTPDFDQRHLCHDVILAGIMTLDKSERVLKTNMNLTLSDFEWAPAIVGHVVNNSASTLDLYGLRIGRMKYEEMTAELDSEVTWITQWQEGRIRLLYKVTRPVVDSTSTYNISTYRLIPTNNEKPVWLTKTGYPPKDLSTVHIKIAIYPSIALTILTASVGLGLVWQVILVAISLRTRASPTGNDMTPSSHKDTSYPQYHRFSKMSNILLSATCGLVNISALVSAVGTRYFYAESCAILPVLAVLGVTLTNSCLCYRMVTYHQLMKQDVKRKSDQVSTIISNQAHKTSVTTKISIRSTVSKGIASTYIRDEHALSKFRVEFSIGICVTLTFLIVLLSVWLSIYPIRLETWMSPVNFDENDDSYYQIRAQFCSSSNQMDWIAAFVALNVVLLLYACFLAYRTRKNNLHKELQSNCKAYRLAILNGTTTFLAILLLMFIVPRPVDGFAQLIVFGFGEVLYAASTVSIVFFRSLQKVVARTDHLID